jgi:hypothetical protein
MSPVSAARHSSRQLVSGGPAGAAGRGPCPSEKGRNCRQEPSVPAEHTHIQDELLALDALYEAHDCADHTRCSFLRICLTCI